MNVALVIGFYSLIIVAPLGWLLAAAMCLAAGRADRKFAQHTDEALAVVEHPDIDLGWHAGDDRALREWWTQL